MALGTCPKCGRLTAIYARGQASHPVHLVGGRALQHASNRQLAWFTVPHRTEAGEDCDGHATEIGSTAADSTPPKERP